ncbi:RICIN domain-containing protein [Fulvivirga maritima]|uniref:RICIN domain-containing protein n=1 Tax=Fulvivirga maritima TaxID=2904247 RepID=UPI001F20A8D1|nr:RICIN domain-containing protein [Fulvivirga maritima]UII29533.1 RICIN domain-containing protein [Fulvivirga maritima]
MNKLHSIFSLLLIAVFSVTGYLIAEAQVIQNNEFWHDTSGNPIYSQGGGVLKVGDTYYWYGAKYRGAITYFNDPYSGKNGDTGFLAITCYSSTDLANWTYEGDVMTPADGLQAGWVGRIGCAYNAPTGKYVLIAQMYPGLAFGTSDTPTGRFTLAATQSTIGNVVNDMSGDQSVFTDDNGQAYLAFCNVRGRNNQYVSRLRPSDYLYVEPATRIHRASSGREGNVMFKHNGTYYFISSDLHGWNTSRTYCITASNILGPYSNEFVIQGSERDYSHVTQSGLAFAVNGTSGSFVMFGGDRWADFAGNGVGYNQWVPISFNGTTPIFHSLSQWNINESAGTWSVGSGNNYVLNPNFEADRIDVSTVTGWTNWVGSGSNPNGNLQGSHFPGRFCLEQWSSSPYEASMFQTISLPNGTYTLKTWVKSSGGQTAARIYVKGFGSSEKTYSINQSISSWTEITIPNINVTNGSIEVGVYSNASGGNWVNVDDFSLISTGGANPGTTYVRFQNRATGLFLDGMGRTANGEACGQYANTTHVNAQWELVDAGGGYYQLRNRGTGLFLDGMGRTNNGAECGQYANTTHVNSQWSLQQYSGSYYRLRNRGTGLYLDGLGYTANGDVVGQWANSTSQNAQWEMINVATNARVVTQENIMLEPEAGKTSDDILFYPNPTSNMFNIQLKQNDRAAGVKIFNLSGQVVMSSKLYNRNNQIIVKDLQEGTYFIEVTSDYGTTRFKMIKE